MRLILASNSPRRHELLARLTDDFVVVPSHVDETGIGSPSERVVSAARAKARSVGQFEHGVIVGADTMVVANQQSFGKPRTLEQARTMIKTLSGGVHVVLTGLCVWNTHSGLERLHCEETEVTFRTLHPDEIEAYLDSGEYCDRAGAYAIQGSAAKFICSIQGDYTNVIGLPLCRLTCLLREVGVEL